MRVEVGVEQRDVEVLAAPGAFAMEQGETDRSRGAESGLDIAHRGAGKIRRTVALAGHVNHAGIGAADRIEAGLQRQRTALAEGRYRAHDRARIELAHRIVAETHAAD